MIQSARIAELNGREPLGGRRGRFVLYWMQQSQRANWNHALEYAIERANGSGLPVVVGFGLMEDYPEANLRHYQFMAEGLVETSRRLRERGIRMVVRRGRPDEVAVRMAERAALVVCDCGYTAHQRRWVDRVADECACQVVQVESDVIVPVQEVLEKAEVGARTIRPKLLRRLEEFLEPLEERQVRRDSLEVKISGAAEIGSVEEVLSGLRLDKSVRPVRRFRGGAAEAEARLRRFLAEGLRRYDRERSEPAGDAVSMLSPYLHFGQISALEVALAVRQAKAPAAAKEAFLEQLIVRRELSCNFTEFTPNYWTYEAMPAWARRSLEEHSGDVRKVYSRGELERAETDDPFWNAAMSEMVHTGYMPNTMRMYWGKRVIGWKRRPSEAFVDLIHLNNKYLLDGRDANGFAGVGWCFGLHDRPWPARKVYGNVRCMNAAGLERKFDMEAYLRRVGELIGAEGKVQAGL